MTGSVVVTGTSSGIGFATALRLARSGWRLHAGMRDVAKAGPLLDAAEGLDLSAVSLDVTDLVSIKRAFAAVQSDGPLDALVNNAGIAGAAPLEETTDAENRAMFETNYFGSVRCIQQVLPQMRERGAGVIVNVTSLSGLFPWPAGADAVAIAEARSIAPLGEWVALGGDVADADYNAWFERYLNIAL